MREAQAKLALQDLSPSQLAVVQKMSGGVSAVSKATHLEISTIKNALASLLKASKSRDLDLILGLIQDAIAGLRSLEPPKVVGEKTPSVGESLATIARSQLKSLARMSRTEETLGKLLALRTPSPARRRERAEKKVRRIMGKVDAEVQPDPEDDATAAARHHIQDEIARSKRG